MMHPEKCFKCRNRNIISTFLENADKESREIALDMILGLETIWFDSEKNIVDTFREKKTILGM